MRGTAAELTSASCAKDADDDMVSNPDQDQISDQGGSHVTLCGCALVTQTIAK